MPIPLTAQEVLDREFLQIRAKILELAASLDRLDRASGGIDEDARVALIRQGLDVLRGEDPDRAEQVQMIFSRPYDDVWRENLNV